MANIQKYSIILTGILFTMCVLLSLFAAAEPLPSPSVPDYLPTPAVPSFTVSFVNRFSDTPVQTQIDPYNGSVITITDPRREKGEIEIKIANQHFSRGELQYKISTKGFYEDIWLYENNWPQINNDSSSEPQYTIVYLPANYRVGDKIDFKVQAVAKYQYEFMTTYSIPNHPPMPTVGTAIGYKSSEWSQIQTFTMPDTSTPTTTPTQNAPEFTALSTNPLTIGIIILTISVLIAAVIIKKTTQKQKEN
jgi:hypothetical protein